MIIRAQTWLNWTRHISNDRHSEWIQAMEGEFYEISDMDEQTRFARGCFLSIVWMTACSRRGLQYMARGCGTLLIIIAIISGLWIFIKFRFSAQALIQSWMIIGLLLFYLPSAFFLLKSLKNLQIYAKTGLILALSIWGCSYYYIVVYSGYEISTPFFLIAISLEMAGFMISLWAISIALSWLYNPRLHHDR